MAEIIMYTDGSARGNPGKGGYGVVLICGNHYRELSEGYQHTTNNRMELLAVVKGIEALKGDGHSITVYTDSKYVCDAVEKGWLKSWILTNFKGKKNSDLWIRYYKISKLHSVKFKWVKGHADNKFNNRCDVLATQEADNNPVLIDEGYVQ